MKKNKNKIIMMLMVVTMLFSLIQMNLISATDGENFLVTNEIRIVNEAIEDSGNIAMILQKDGSCFFRLPINISPESNSNDDLSFRDGGGYIGGKYYPETGFLELGTQTGGFNLIKSISVEITLSGSVNKRVIHQSRTLIVPGPYISTDGQYHIGTPIANVPHGVIYASMTGSLYTVTSHTFISSSGSLTF